MQRNQKLQNAATIAHTAQIVAKILRSAERKIEDVRGEEQFGFRRGIGAEDVIGMLRIVSERTLDIGKELCACVRARARALHRLAEGI